MNTIKGQHIHTGRAGEEQARAYLVSRGYTLIEANFRVPQGEMDIIARHRGDIVFVEVKTRKDNRFGWPAEAVNWKKRMKLRNVARAWLQKNDQRDVSYRFDVIAITLMDNNVELIQSAF